MNKNLSNIKVVSINAHGKYSTGNIASLLTEMLNNGSKFFHSRDEINKEFATKFCSAFETKADIVLTRLSGIDSVWSWNNTRKILNALKKEKPDIVHLHNLHGFYINYKKLFRFIKKNNIKIVWTLHDCWSFTGHCPYFDFVRCDKWQTECYDCPLKKQTYLKSWFFDRSKANFRRKEKAFCGVENLTIVTPSKWLAGLVKQSFLKDYPVEVINNGIDTDNFTICDNVSFKHKIPSDKKIMLAVASSWDKRKGLHDIVAISRQLSDEYIVVVVGVSEEQSKQLFGERIITINRTDNQQQLAELYSMASVFINPTYEDNYPTVNIEALCCGCPIITYNTGGSVETITEETGIIVPKGDIDAMLEAIKVVGSRNYDRKNISLKAKTLYSKNAMVDKYLELYTKM